MEQITISSMGDLSAEIRRRIDRMVDRLTPGSPELEKVVHKIGKQMVIYAKHEGMNATTKDTNTFAPVYRDGGLLDSLRYDIKQKGKKQIGVRVGTKGVKYAAAVEKGSYFGPEQRKAFFAKMNEGLIAQKSPTGVAVGSRLQSRPFLERAVTNNTDEILQIVRDFVIMSLK